jgi:phosphatidylethanolamine-binding protein (PEBP) family uncharacterized protein
MGRQKPPIPVAILAVSAVLAILTGCGGSKTPSSSQTSPAASTPAASVPPAHTASTSTAPSAGTKSTLAGTQSQKHAEEEPGPAQEKVEIASPVVKTEGLLSSRYTCDGQNAPLPLRWRGIPPGTSELMLDILKISPVNGELFFDWAITGLKPNSTGVGPGKLPSGAIVGANSLGHAGYTLCPPKGAPEKYVAVLFALTHKLATKNAFNATALRLKALHDSKYEGFFFFNYQRH